MAIAGLVVIAAKMLTGGIVIGYHGWTEWNNPELTGVICSIRIISVAGMPLDRALSAAASFVQYRESGNNHGEGCSRSDKSDETILESSGW